MHRPMLGPTLLAVIICVVGTIYWTTFHGLAIHGDRSDAAWRPAFVLAAFVWMLWGMRQRLLATPVVAFLPGILLLAGAGVAWLIGEFVFVRVLSNFAAAAMIPAAVLTVLGWQWLRILAFPIAFLFFIVPVGGPLIPMLVDWTAAVSFWSLNASGLPVHREGAYFELSSGRWSVADACSGIEYLTTCAMLGSVFAWEIFRQRRKQLVFFAAAILLGVVGNWLRVYLTIAIAHLTNNLWLRDSHGTFGWVLFAGLMVCLIVIGWRFRDESNFVTPAPLVDSSKSMRRTMLAMLLAMCTVSVWPLFADTQRTGRAPKVVEPLKVQPRNGWIPSTDRASAWLPDLQNPRSIRVQSFEKNNSRVDLIIALFHDQNWTSQLSTSANQVVNSENKNWSLASRDKALINYLGKDVKVHSSLIIGGGAKAIVWHWYWLHGETTANDVEAKRLQLGHRLSGKGDLGAWVAICADASVTPQMANDLLTLFMKDMDSSLESALSMTDAR
ncbi:MAG: EpsI family protein [Betaproteobacteria bacterium]|nr:EpsI family protein [Betaproteobacteria bacterium]